MIRMCFSQMVFALFLLAASSVFGQAEDRDFGWSLTVSPNARKEEEKRRARVPPQRESHEDAEIRVETQLVLSDLLVQDKNGNPVLGLSSSDFEIAENGEAQNVDVFTFGDSAIPRSIVLVIDHSLSQWRHIDRSVAAAKVLVDSLRATDRMAIVSDDIELISDLTSDKEELKAKLEGLRRKCGEGRFGKSQQYSALFAVLNEKIVRNGTRNIVIFQTDGDEYASLLGNRNRGTGGFSINDIVNAAERKGVTIYSVFTGPTYSGVPKREMIERARDDLIAQMNAFPATVNRAGPATPVRFSERYLERRAMRVRDEEAAVGSVAVRSGGIAQSLELPEQAAAVYEKILSDIGRRYLVGYYPTGSFDGEPREREVRITLRNKGKYRVVGGRTYVAY